MNLSQSQFNAPQCPITQNQCEQILSFLASQSFKEAATSQPTSTHQVAFVLSPLSNAAATASTSSTMPYFTNFSGNPFWLPPNLSHSIFSAHIIDRQAYKSNDWIINTGATDHMVHSVSCLTIITSTINTFVYLPNGEKALVTVEREKFPTYHKLTHHTTESTKCSQLQSTTYCY